MRTQVLAPAATLASRSHSHDHCPRSLGPRGSCSHLAHGGRRLGGGGVVPHLLPNGGHHLQMGRPLTTGSTSRWWHIYSRRAGNGGCANSKQNQYPMSHSWSSCSSEGSTLQGSRAALSVHTAHSAPASQPKPSHSQAGVGRPTTHDGQRQADAADDERPDNHRLQLISGAASRLKSTGDRLAGLQAGSLNGRSACIVWRTTQLCLPPPQRCSPQSYPRTHLLQGEGIQRCSSLSGQCKHSHSRAAQQVEGHTAGQRQ